MAYGHDPVTRPPVAVAFQPALPREDPPLTDTSAIDPIDPAGVPVADVPDVVLPAPEVVPEPVPDVPEPEVVEPVVVEPVAEAGVQPEPTPVGHQIVQDNTVPGVQTTRSVDGTVTSETAV